MLDMVRSKTAKYAYIFILNFWICNNTLKTFLALDVRKTILSVYIFVQILWSTAYDHYSFKGFSGFFSNCTLSGLS